MAYFHSMITKLVEGGLHAMAAIGTMTTGAYMAQAIPINDQTPITIGVAMAALCGAFYTGVKLTNVIRDIKQLKEYVAQNEVRRARDDRDARAAARTDRNGGE